MNTVSIVRAVSGVILEAASIPIKKATTEISIKVRNRTFVWKIPPIILPITEPIIIGVKIKPALVAVLPYTA